MESRLDGENDRLCPLSALVLDRRLAVSTECVKTLCEGCRSALLWKAKTEAAHSESPS